MQVSLVDYTQDAEAKIASYAAICYGAKTDEESNSRRISSLLKLGHLSTLRFASATFLVSGISRACSHQLVRHKFLDYLQESQRYVDQADTKFFIPDVDDVARVKMTAIFDTCIKEYNCLIELGERKETARYVLPEATCTKMFITGNFQAWKDFLKLRQDKSAQWELRNVANKIALELEKVAPTIFKPEGDIARMV